MNGPEEGRERLEIIVGYILSESYPKNDTIQWGFLPSSNP
ncbi:hypothetical protein J2Y40_003064 [Chryseobacterium sp. 2987]|nr:hypothetical protein [Chryseobacterium sp. 2987]